MGNTVSVEGFEARATGGGGKGGAPKNRERRRRRRRDWSYRKRFRQQEPMPVWPSWGDRSPRIGRGGPTANKKRPPSLARKP